MIEKLEVKEWLQLNAALQLKKNNLRKTLKEKGVLKKGAVNEFDRYKYFSEAQYKELFTELLSDHGLELKFSEIAYDTFEGTEKQANGRMPKLEFTLFDVDTGFYENTVITGEGIDKGDKAGYKAYTGALKYYLANTFLVATGDDPEKESPATKMNSKKSDYETLMKTAIQERQNLAGMYAKLGQDIHSEQIAKYLREKANTETADPAFITDVDGLKRLIKVFKSQYEACMKKYGEQIISSKAATF